MRAFEAERNGVVAEADKFIVKTQDQCDMANVVRTKLRSKEKLIEEGFETILRPQRTALDRVRSLKKQVLAPFQTARSTLTDKVMQWRREEQAKIDEERRKAEAEEERRRKIQEAHAEKGHKVSAPAEVARPEPLKVRDTTRTRKVWNYKVTAFSKVPDGYKELNKGMVRETMKDRDESGKPLTDIPGIEWLCEEIPIA